MVRMTTPAGTPFDRSVLIGLAVLLEVAIVLFALALDWRPSLAIGVGPVTGSAVAVVISALVVPLTTSENPRGQRIASVSEAQPRWWRPEEADAESDATG
jgi:hypothetical protein